jgi:hypothetical protein
VAVAKVENLERSKVWIDGEDVDELQVGEDVGGGEEALRDEHRVPRVPVLAGEVGRGAAAPDLFLHLKFTSTGADVMITIFAIFANFQQIFCKELAVCSYVEKKMPDIFFHLK